MTNRFSYLAETARSRLDVFLSEKCAVSRSYAKEQIVAGNVRVNGTLVTKPSQKLKAQDRIEGSFTVTHAISLEPVAKDLDVLFEDKDVLVLNKAQGVVVHPTPAHKGETLVHYLLHHFRTSDSLSELDPSRPGIVHRLDKGTSGVLVIAKNRSAQENLSNQFKNRSLRKEYEAVVWGITRPEGTFDTMIGRDRRDRKKMSSRTRKGRSAVTHWKRLQAFVHFSHVQLLPRTGRTHQLRVQLSEDGHPVVGDSTYFRRSFLSPKLNLSPILVNALDSLSSTLLHAKSLTFAHPASGAEIRVEAPRPDVFDKFLTLLKNFDR